MCWAASWQWYYASIINNTTDYHSSYCWWNHLLICSHVASRRQISDVLTATFHIKDDDNALAAPDPIRRQVFKNSHNSFLFDISNIHWNIIGAILHNPSCKIDLFSKYTDVHNTGR